MYFQEKYLKYKNKYLNLKNQLGGSSSSSLSSSSSSSYTAKIYLAVHETSPEYITFLTGTSKGVFGNKTKYINIDSHNELNERDMFLKLNNKNIDITDIVKWVDKYDELISIHILSESSQIFWNDIAITTKQNIAIFYGHGHTFKVNIQSDDINKFIVGLNILLGCTTNDHAKQLNTLYNQSGKYFIGFRDYLHMYGNSIYICDSALKSNENTFRDNTLTDDNLLTITKLFYTNFFNRCSESSTTKCRKCFEINKDNIIKKINSIKPKIDKGTYFSGNNSDFYFNSEYYCECVPIVEATKSCCNENTDFIRYINDLYEKYLYTIKIKTLVGNKHYLKVNKDYTIYDIHNMLKKFYPDLNISDYNLVFNGSVLRSSITLDQYNISEGAKISLILICKVGNCNRYPDGFI